MVSSFTQQEIYKMYPESIEIEDCTDPSYHPWPDSVTVIDDPISYQEFFRHFLLTNTPCIIGNFISEDWSSRTDWVDGSSPNWSHIRQFYGDTEVPVADCNERLFDSQKKSTYTVKKYLDYWEEYSHLKQPSHHCLYLKDWHLTRDYPDKRIYRVPPYFACDWLNEYYTSRKDLNDDYRFVYMGPKGSWTPLHADVFTSYSWSVNVTGRKRWLLFPPGQDVYLKDRLGNLAYDTADLEDEASYPSYGRLQKSYEVIQEAGEGIFVPSGWHHQVWNLEDTISINHNWVNGCNIRQVWAALQASLAAVQHEVMDCRDMDDWEEHCQIMLRASHGMNYEEFFDMLDCVAQPRLAQLNRDQVLSMYGDWVLGHRHAAWDLRQILAIVINLLQDGNTHVLSWVSVKKPNELRDRISKTLDVYANKEKLH